MEPWSPPARPANAPETPKPSTRQERLQEIGRLLFIAAMIANLGYVFFSIAHVSSEDEREHWFERCVDLTERHDTDLGELRRRRAHCDLLWEARPR